MDLPSGEDGIGSLGVILAAAPATEGSPALRLSLLPHAVLHNCTPYQIFIKVRWHDATSAGNVRILSTSVVVRSLHQDFLGLGFYGDPRRFLTV